MAMTATECLRRPERFEAAGPRVARTDDPHGGTRPGEARTGWNPEPGYSEQPGSKNRSGDEGLSLQTLDITPRAA